MSCQRMIRMLSVRQDGELSPERERRLEAHLRGCDACRAEWLALQRVVHGLRLAQPPAVDPFFPARVMAALPVRPAARTRLVQAAAYVLTFAMIFAGGLFLQVSSVVRPAVVPAAAPTYSAVLLESQDLGLLSVQDDTLNLFAGGGHE